MADEPDKPAFERDPEVLEEILQTTRDLTASMLELEEKAALHKQAKARTDALHDRLFKLNQEYERSDREPSLPFSDAMADPVADDDEAWRGVKLADIGVKGKTLEILTKQDPPSTRSARCRTSRTAHTSPTSSPTSTASARKRRTPSTMPSRNTGGRTRARPNRATRKRARAATTRKPPRCRPKRTQ